MGGNTRSLTLWFSNDREVQEFLEHLAAHKEWALEFDRTMYESAAEAEEFDVTKIYR